MLGLVLLVPYFVWMLGQSLADLPVAQRVASVVLRAAFLAVLAFGLARVARTATTQKVCTVYLVDVSDSVPDASLEDARARDPERARREAGRRAGTRDHLRAPPAGRPPRRRREADAARRPPRSPRYAAGHEDRLRRQGPISRAPSSSPMAFTPPAICGARSSSPTASRPTAISSPRRTGLAASG